MSIENQSKYRTTKQIRIDKCGNILCTYCMKYKPKKEFLQTNLNRHFYKCILCNYEYRKKNVNSLICNIYTHQKYRIKGELPYTVNEFSKWLATTNFFDLYRSWVAFGYIKDNIPTVLRIDTKKPYALDNLRVTIAKLARLTFSHMRDRKVIQMDFQNNELATFSNARVAASFLGVKCYSNIHEVCRGRRKTAMGFYWKYAV